MRYGLEIKVLSRCTLNYISKLLQALKLQKFTHGHRHEKGKCQKKFKKNFVQLPYPIRGILTIFCLFDYVAL